MAIHIRQIMPAQWSLVCPQGARDHGRAKIRPANADIEHIGKALTRGCKDAPFMHGAGEFFHARTHRKHFGHDILSARAEIIARFSAQRHMQRRAAFRGIHRSARKKPRAEARDIRGLRKREQCLQYRIRNRGFGKIEQHIASLTRKRCEAIRISGEKRANSRRIRPCGQSHQRRPGGFARVLCHWLSLPCLRGETMAEGLVI